MAEITDSNLKTFYDKCLKKKLPVEYDKDAVVIRCKEPEDFLKFFDFYKSSCTEPVNIGVIFMPQNK